MRALFAATLLATSFLALPSTAQSDPRLVEREYSPAEVVRINGRTNVQATIRFAQGEQIQNVAIGDSQAWQVTPSRSANLLFVKPLTPRAATNMTVVTDRRVYLFDLVANPATRSPLYVLTFSYPDAVLTQGEQAELAQAAEATEQALSASPEEIAAATDDFAVLDPATLNFSWITEGAPALLPQTVYDNGEATFMEWREGEPMPAILVKDDDGTEGPVNFAVRGTVIVIDGVPAEIILRSGDDAARLVNNGPTRLAGA